MSASTDFSFDFQDLLLKPKMYVQGVVDTPGGKRTALAVPEEAVQTINGEPAVFVLARPDTFVPYPVELGERVGTSRIVLTGLEGRERVAVGGAFNLKSELMKASLGGE